MFHIDVPLVIPRMYNKTNATTLAVSSFSMQIWEKHCQRQTTIKTTTMEILCYLVILF